MLLKLVVVLSLNVFTILARENKLLDVKSKHQDGNNRNEIGLEAYGYGIYQCPMLSGSPPKAETGCCGRHTQQGRATYGNRLINKRSISSEEVSDEDDYYDIYADYTEYDYDSSEDVNDTLSSFREKRTIMADSDIPPNKFIVAGHAVDIGVYPWLVSLEIEVPFCGGSLINSKYVVTAAHCVNDLNRRISSLNAVNVVLAEYDTRTKRDCVQYRNGQRRCVDNVVMHPEQIITHPQYNSYYNHNDIAMLRLRGNAPYTDYIRPICLPTFDIGSKRNRGLDLVVAGWGMILQNGPSSAVKLQTVVNLVPFAECQTRTPVPPGKLCAIGQNGQDACYGDSRGPLMTYYDGNYVLAGIVSGKHTIGAPCGSRTTPTTYVNVYQYSRWIRSNMRP